MDSNKGEKKMDSSAALDFGSIENMFDDMFSNNTNQVKEEKTETINENVQKELTNEEVEQLGNKVENISNVNISTALSKLASIEMELNNEFVERNELIKIMILSVVTNSNLLMLGPPGTARV